MCCHDFSIIFLAHILYSINILVLVLYFTWTHKHAKVTKTSAISLCRLWHYILENFRFSHRSKYPNRMNWRKQHEASISWLFFFAFLFLVVPSCFSILKTDAFGWLSIQTHLIPNWKQSRKRNGQSKPEWIWFEQQHKITANMNRANENEW